MNDYEEFVKTTDVKVGDHDLEFYFDGMREESGEISGVLKRIRRGDYGQQARNTAMSEGVGAVLNLNYDARKDFIKEIGDEHWYQTRALQELGLDWDTIEKVNMDKLKKRLDTGTIVGKGDNREDLKA